MKYKVIDIDKWNRKEHFNFYSQFNNPFFGIVADVSATKLYETSKLQDTSFYLSYMHAVATIINSQDAFKTRIVDGQAIIYDTIHVSATVFRADNTFGFSFIEYHEELDQFITSAQEEIARVKATSGLFTFGSEIRYDCIHFSALPWISFSGIEHAGHIGSGDTCPKVSVGKMKKVHGQIILPISLHLHHACADGYDAGIFYTQLETALNG
jgi:chloramphenicol O-acetyltransferase type A